MWRGQGKLGRGGEEGQLQLQPVRCFLSSTFLLARDVAHQDLILWTHWRAPPIGQGTGLPTPLGSQGSLDSHSPHPRSLPPLWTSPSLYPKHQARQAPAGQ